MNLTLPFMSMLVLTACAAGTVPPHLPAHEASKTVSDMPTPPEDVSTAKLTPDEILVAAQQARSDAAGYVAWKYSKDSNIDRLTTLTVALNIAVARMKANEHGKKYTSVDVLAAREALHELRQFLVTKSD